MLLNCDIINGAIRIFCKTASFARPHRRFFRDEVVTHVTNRRIYEKNNFLQQLLFELPADTLEKIKICRLKRGALVVPKCQDNRNTYVILDGVCSTIHTFASGSRVFSQKSTVNDVIGFSGIFNENRDFSASIHAKTDVILAMFSEELILECFGQYKCFSFSITKAVLNRIHNFNYLQRECFSHPISLGAITYLCYAYTFYKCLYPSDYQGAVKILESRQEMANFFGVNIRTIHRLIPKLEEKGLLCLKRGQIYINPQQYSKLKLAHDEATG